MTYFYSSCFTHKGRVYGRWTEDGREVMRRVDFRPKTYEPCRDSSTPFRSIYGQPLLEVEHDDLYAARQYAERYADVGNFKLWGNRQHHWEWAYEKFFGRLEWTFDDLKVDFVDIETEVDGSKPDVVNAPSAVNIVTLKRRLRDHFETFTTLNVSQSDFPDEVRLTRLDTEADLLRAVVRRLRDDPPTILSGWFSEGFDLPYLVRRVKRVLGDEAASRMSPFGIVVETTKKTKTREVTTYDLMGVSHLDLQAVYKKFVVAPRASYKLDEIARIELGSEKLRHESGVPGHLLYRDYPVAAVEYNVQDVRLLEELEEKTNLLHMCCGMAYGAMVNPEDVMSPMRTWQGLIYCDLRSRGTFFEYETKRPESKDAKFAGGYVKDSLTGKYEWVVSYDVQSMYPSLIRALNLSPEMVAEHHGATLKDVLDASKRIDVPDHRTLAANGWLFKTDEEGFIPRLTRQMFEERRSTKKRMLELERGGDQSREVKDEVKRLSIHEKSLKITLNSAFGIMGSPFFRFFDLRIAEGITLTGQAFIRWVGRDVNDALNRLLKTSGADYVVASDTDSCYFNVGPVVRKRFPRGHSKEEALDWIAGPFERQMQSVVAKSISKFAERLRVRDPEVLVMKREAISDSSIFMAKKHYVMSVLDNEGVRRPKQKVMGHQSIKSVTPPVCKPMFDEAFRVMLHGEERDLHDVVRRAYEKFATAPVSAYASTTGITDIDKWGTGGGGWKSGTPYHVKASMAYNDAVRRAGLEEKFEPIEEGDKIRVVALSTPNPVGSDYVGFKDEEALTALGLSDYVDVRSLWEKFFEGPLEDVARHRGWSLSSTGGGVDF